MTTVKVEDRITLKNALKDEFFYVPLLANFLETPASEYVLNIGNNIGNERKRA